MTDTCIRIRPVNLPHGPRATMARLRSEGRYALLESALVVPDLAQWSYIAGPARATLYTDEVVTVLDCEGHCLGRWDDAFDALADVTSVGPLHIDGMRPAGMGLVGGWVGALGYDLARGIERLPQCALHDPVLPRQWWMAVDQVLAFHHPSGRWWHATATGPRDRWPFTRDDRTASWAHTLARAAGAEPARGRWATGGRDLRTDRTAFERDVQRIRDAIAAGELLQANLTRREDAAFEGDAWTLYEDLMHAHPAPFAAFLDGPGFTIASASPERFLKRRGTSVQARPMKGTAPRGVDAAQDEALQQALATSVKDRAENVMIVDLMRNDLGRVAVTGSVHVPELFTLEPYASVWQMVSTVTATLPDDCGNAALLRSCWPPGSMTGAPKIRAMQLIEALEPVRRGFYSGSIGYLDCSGNLDLSVVIRSAVIAGQRLMIQLGAGIVADSQPAAEWAETVAKGERLTAMLDQGASEPYEPAIPPRQAMPRDAT